MDKVKQLDRRSLALVIAAITGAGCWGTVSAEEKQQGILEEIVTTAQKRPESLQSVPISVNTVGGEKLDNAGITNLEKLTAYIPNFSMNQTGIGSTITIRGISSGINQGFEQSVGQYVDGIYYGRAAVSRAPFLDLERVEVLRGPQGTLFGKNSIGGAISMVSARPTEEFEGSASVLYEPGDGEREIRLVASGALSDSVRGRLAIMDRTIDGYVRNTTLSRDEKGEDEQVFRASLEWDINDDWSLYFKAERTEFDVQGRNIEVFGSVALPAPGAVDYLSVLNTLQGALGRDLVDGTINRVRDSNGDFSSDTIDNFVVELDYQVGDHEIKFLSGWLEYDHEELCDCDFTGASVFTADGTEKFEQFSQEIRLTSPAGEDFEYITGIYYQSNDLDFNDRLLVPTSSVLSVTSAAPLVGLSSRRNFTQDGDLWAAFFQGTWNLNEYWRLTAGGRYTSEKKNASRNQSHFDAAGVEFGASNPLLNAAISAVNIEPYDTIRGSRDEGAFTPLVTVQWDVSADAMLYATWTKGFKSGGFDVRSNAHPDPDYGVNVFVPTGVGPGGQPIGIIVPNLGPQGSFEFEEEEATSIELGAKLGLLDGAAELNAAIFFTDYDDLQVSQFDGVLGFNVTNAGQASIEGFELEGRWLAADNFTVSSSLSYLDFEYDVFPNSQCYFGQAFLDPSSVTDSARGLCDVAGERKEYTPEWRATLVGDHFMMVADDYQLRTTVDVLYVDDYLWNPTLDPRSQQDSYIDVNARIAFGPADGSWEVSLLGKNLTNEEVINFGGDAPLASLLTSRSGNAYYGFINRDRSVAIQAKVNF